MKTIPVEEVKVGDIIYSKPLGVELSCGEVLESYNGRIKYKPNKLDKNGGSDTLNYSFIFPDKVKILEKSDIDLLILSS